MRVRIFFRGLTLFVPRNPDNAPDHGLIALLLRGHPPPTHVPIMHWFARATQSIDPYRCRLDVLPDHANILVDRYEGDREPDERYVEEGRRPSSCNDAKAFTWVPSLRRFSQEGTIRTELLGPKNVPDMVNTQVLLRGGQLRTSRLVHFRKLEELKDLNDGAEAQFVRWQNSDRQNETLAEEVVWISDKLEQEQITIRPSSLDNNNEVHDLILKPNQKALHDFDGQSDSVVDIVVSNLPYPPHPLKEGEKARECGEHFRHFFEAVRPVPGGSLPLPCPSFKLGEPQVIDFGIPGDFPITPAKGAQFMLPEDRPICPPACCEE